MKKTALYLERAAWNGRLGTGGFSVRKENSSIGDALADFREQAGKAAWEKAFAALSKVSESASPGLVRCDDGFYLPARVRVRQLLVDLPPAGREAFRLFNDSQAKQLFAQLDNPGEFNSAVERTAKLQELFDRFFITSIGDQIGDRLGSRPPVG